LFLTKMKRILCAIAALTLSLSTLTATAQEEVERTTPFDYPVVPDTCSTLESRCNFLCQHFWDNYDISKPIPNDNDFLKAFRDYIEFFQYANRNVVMTSIGNLMNKASSNTSNLLKVGQAAELSLFLPTAVYYSDEVYVEFAKALANNSMLKKDVRNYYGDQLARINACQEGHPLPDIEVVDANGEKIKLSQTQNDSTTMVIFFYNDKIESVMERTRLSADANLNTLIQNGGVKVLSIYLGKYKSGFAATMPENWQNTCSEQALKLYDFRALPCCYIVGKDLVLATKNISVDELKEGIAN